MLLRALKNGYDACLYLDTDVLISPEAPDIFTEQSAQGKAICCANGYTGRINSGVILAFDTVQTTRLLSDILQDAGTHLQAQHSIGWGENGYFIKRLSTCPDFGLVERTWNNTFDFELAAHFTHFTGPMRAKYIFSDNEQAAWDEIQARPKPKGEGSIAENCPQFFADLTAFYNRLSQDHPEFSDFDMTWRGISP